MGKKILTSDQAGQTILKTILEKDAEKFEEPLKTLILRWHQLSEAADQYDVLVSERQRLLNDAQMQRVKTLGAQENLEMMILQEGARPT